MIWVVHSICAVYVIGCQKWTRINDGDTNIVNRRCQLWLDPVTETDFFLFHSESLVLHRKVHWCREIYTWIHELEFLQMHNIVNEFVNWLDELSYCHVATCDQMIFHAAVSDVGDFVATAIQSLRAYGHRHIIYFKLCFIVVLPGIAIYLSLST